MNTPIQVAFSELLSSWDASCEENRTSVGPGWEIAQLGLNLQVDALQQIQGSGLFDETVQENAFLLAGMHSARLLASAFSLVIRGYFDVALYLARPVKDAEAILLGCGRDLDFARRVVADEAHLARTARTELIAWFRDSQVDHEFVETLNARFLADADAGNNAAHTRAHHLYRVVAGDVAVGPTLAGIANTEMDAELWAAFLEVSDWKLRWISLIADDCLSDDWKAQHRDFDQREGNYRNAYATERRPQP